MTQQLQRCRLEKIVLVILFSFGKTSSTAAAVSRGRDVGGYPDVNLGVDEHAVHKQAGRADDISSLGEQRNMAISWKQGSEFEHCQPNFF